ncbi:hypothetical protein ANO11243_062400 [Dothideomycetidae sp. 11243]|nr:hypothetical protein ANO11243_062400 [fungal sp. No.11243]
MIRTAAIAAAALVGLVAASPAPAPQMLDFNQLAAAPTVATGPTGIIDDQSVSIASTVVVTTVAVPAATGLSRRNLAQEIQGIINAWDCLIFHQCTGTTTTSSTSACATVPEAGTYCGFINPEDPCAPQPDGYGPANLTVDQFMSYPEFQNDANNAPVQLASSTAGQIYTEVFKDLNASVSANSYLGLYTLQSYDVAGCASYCDNTALCTAFNIYIERDPSQNPTANDTTSTLTQWGTWCPNPPAITNYKCTLWGSSISASVATNYGQWREQFEVVFVASNGYDKTNGTIPTVTVSSTTPSSTSTQPSTSSPGTTSTVPPTTSAITTTAVSTTTTMVTSTKTPSPTVPATTSKNGTSTTTCTTTSKTTTTTTTTSSGPSIPTWNPGHNCGGKAVNYPGQWMGGKVFPGPYNPQICADYAWAQNAANKASAQLSGAHSWTPCKYINAIYYHKNGIPYGTYCNLYANVVDSSYETYSGGYSGKDYYSCAQSWTFQLVVDVNFATC